MAREAYTYRAARKNAARAAKLDWRNGAGTVNGRGDFRYGVHASMVQPQFNGVPAAKPRQTPDAGVA